MCKDSSNLESLLRSHLVAAPLLGVVGSSPTPLLLLPFLSPTDTHTQKKKKRTQVSSVIVTFQGHPSTQSLLPCRAQFISHKQSSILCRLLSSSLPPTFPSQFFLEGVISQKLKKKKMGWKEKNHRCHWQKRICSKLNMSVLPQSWCARRLVLPQTSQSLPVFETALLTKRKKATTAPPIAFHSCFSPRFTMV